MNATFSHDNDISIYKEISQILSALPLDFFVLSSSNSPEFTLCCLVLAHIGTRKVARYQQKMFFLKCHSCINIYMYLFYLTSPCKLYVNEKEKIHSNTFCCPVIFMMHKDMIFSAPSAQYCFQKAYKTLPMKPCLKFSCMEMGGYQHILILKSLRQP